MHVKLICQAQGCDWILEGDFKKEDVSVWSSFVQENSIEHAWHNHDHVVLAYVGDSRKPFSAACVGDKRRAAGSPRNPIVCTN